MYSAYRAIKKAFDKKEIAIASSFFIPRSGDVWLSGEV